MKTIIILVLGLTMLSCVKEQAPSIDNVYIEKEDIYFTNSGQGFDLIVYNNNTVDLKTVTLSFQMSGSISEIVFYDVPAEGNLLIPFFTNKTKEFIFVEVSNVGF